MFRDGDITRIPPVQKLLEVSERKDESMNPQVGLLERDTLVVVCRKVGVPV